MQICLESKTLNNTLEAEVRKKKCIYSSKRQRIQQNTWYEKHRKIWRDI